MDTGIPRFRNSKYSRPGSASSDAILAPSASRISNTCSRTSNPDPSPGSRSQWSARNAPPRSRTMSRSACPIPSATTRPRLPSASKIDTPRCGKWSHAAIESPRQRATARSSSNSPGPLAEPAPGRQVHAVRVELAHLVGDAVGDDDAPVGQGDGLSRAGERGRASSPSAAPIVRVGAGPISQPRRDPSGGRGFSTMRTSALSRRVGVVMRWGGVGCAGGEEEGEREGGEERGWVVHE